MNRARAPLSLKARALALLAQREHSPQELQRKLLAAVGKDLRRRLAADASEQSDPCALENDKRLALVDEALTQTKTALPELLAELQAAGHLSAERFVQSRVHTRAARFGTRRITQELQQHGLAPDAQTLAGLHESESERALKVFSARFARSGGVAGDTAGRAKQMRYLAARGFSGDAIRAVFKSAGSGQTED